MFLWWSLDQHHIKNDRFPAHLLFGLLIIIIVHYECVIKRLKAHDGYLLRLSYEFTIRWNPTKRYQFITQFNPSFLLCCAKYIKTRYSVQWPPLVLVFCLSFSRCKKENHFDSKDRRMNKRRQKRQENGKRKRAKKIAAHIEWIETWSSISCEEEDGQILNSGCMLWLMLKWGSLTRIFAQQPHFLYEGHSTITRIKI